MRNLLSSLFWICCLACCLVSCRQEPLPGQEDVVASVEETGDQYLTLLDGDAAGTKTDVENPGGYTSAISFADGDQVALFISGSQTSGYKTKTVSTLGSNKVIPVSLATGQARARYAVYPAVAADPNNYGNSTFNIIYPASYDYSAKTVAQMATWCPVPMVAVNNPSVNTLTFYNVGGMLRLTVEAVPADARYIRVTFPGKNITGTFTVTNPGTASATLAEAGGASDLGSTVTVRIAETRLGTSQNLTLNIPLPQGDYGATVTDKTIKVEVVNDSDILVGLGEKKLATWTTLGRSHGKKLSASLLDCWIVLAEGENPETVKFRGLSLSRGVLYYSGNTEDGSHGYSLTDSNDPLVLLQHYGWDTESPKFDGTTGPTGVSGLNVFYHAWFGTNSLKHRIDNVTSATFSTGITGTITIDGTEWHVPSGGTNAGEWEAISNGTKARRIVVNGTPYASEAGNTGNYVCVIVDLSDAVPANGAAADYHDKGTLNPTFNSSGRIESFSGVNGGHGSYGYQSGWLLIPDGANVHSTQVQYVPGNYRQFNANTFNYNLLSWAHLKTLTDGGCVFVPSVGFYRNYFGWRNAGYVGYYWSSSTGRGNNGDGVYWFIPDEYGDYYTGQICEYMGGGPDYCPVFLVHD
jgi:hypothetical protein